MDHLLNSGYIRERLDDRPYYHPLATLSYLAATTRRVSLGTSVLVLPYHNPVELAKYAASLDQMSGGRVILGVGVGAMTEEFESLGVPFNQRGALTNESMAIMRELWTSPDPHYKSDRWNLRLTGTRSPHWRGWWMRPPVHSSVRRPRISHGTSPRLSTSSPSGKRLSCRCTTMKNSRCRRLARCWS